MEWVSLGNTAGGGGCAARVDRTGTTGGETTGGEGLGGGKVGEGNGTGLRTSTCGGGRTVEAASGSSPAMANVCASWTPPARAAPAMY